jgi:hypothetical protein
LSDSGTNLGGIMFDDIGPNQRQGCAIFNKSFIATPPTGDPNPTAWVNRMIFWTACHEMGHCFNLAHSWDKSVPVSWIPLLDEPEARSFMNYPYRVSGGQTAFFANFDYRFSDKELLFLRHAPERFVEMGDALWFDHHGFEQTRRSPEPALRLDMRVNRERPLFEFMEPVVVELKLTNISNQPILVDEKILSNMDHLTVAIKPEGKPARQFSPFAHYCWLPKARILNAGESVYESAFVAAGRNGFDIAEPGYYILQAALHLDDQDVVSNPLRLRITPPRSYDEEYLAQDFFSDQVGRVLNFDGSRYLTEGNDILREVTERLKDRKVAVHARVALGSPLAGEYKLLDLGEGESRMMSAQQAGGKIKVLSSRTEDARKELLTALTTQPEVSAETLGHIDYRYYMERLTDWLTEQGENREAEQLQENLYQTLAARKVLGRVLEEIEDRRESYAVTNNHRTKTAERRPSRRVIPDEGRPVGVTGEN